MAWWIFQNLVVTALLAACVLAIGRAWRLGPVVRHALWVVVLVKFVTPPVVVWPWAAPDPLGIASSFTGARPLSIVPNAPHGRHAIAPIGRDATEDSAALQRPVDAPGMGLAFAAIWPWLFGVWIAGSVCLVAIESLRFSRLARQVRSATAADPVIVRRVVELCERMGIRAIPVVAIHGSRSPAVWGVGRVRLLWPAALAADSDACLDGLLVHELAHVKRRDHFVGWIELAAGIVWWWNPIFWLVRGRRREQAELACDAWVISALPDGRRAYAESLLMLAAFDLPRLPSPSVAVGVLSPSRRALERRLVMIMKGRTSLRLSLAGALGLAVIAGATLPAWATAADQLPPPAAPSVSTPAAAQPPQSLPPLPPSPAQQRLNPPVPKPPPPPPAPAPPQAKPGAAPRWLVEDASPANLPADGRQLVEGFDKERGAIQAEADRQITVRREATVKALQALQEQYTKAGKLDEAVAIREFLRNGGPDSLYRWIIRR